MPALEEAGIWTFDDVETDTEVEFIAATNPGIRLDYGKDGSWIGDSNYKNDRVTLKIGNKEEYAGKIEDATRGKYYIMMNKKEGYNVQQNFKNIVWQ